MSNEAISEAIANEMFGVEAAGRPVYTLADDETLRRIAERAGLEGEPKSALLETVGRTISLNDAGVSPFRWYADGVALHKRDRLQTPLAVPLLLVLTMAAELMEADGDLAAHNYYSRFHRLLRIPTEHWQRVENDYRKHASELWGSLNQWLEAWEGERGIPTAYAIGSHEYIGLPMSQAVVRRHDRVGLQELFALEGMTPGLRLAPEDMSAAMDPYATSTPSPLSSNLRRLWAISAARERIVDAAILELEAWDGSGQPTTMSATRPLSSTKLLAFVRTFPRQSIEFNLLLPFRSDSGSVARFKIGDHGVDVPTIPVPGNLTRLSSVESIHSESLVGEILNGTISDRSEDAFSHRPRRVMPLRWDDLQGAFVEVEQIALGDESIVIARSDARIRIQNHLTEHARPGWIEAPSMVGVPEGWLLYRHVQIVSAPHSGGTHMDLLPLVPRARTSLTLQGGFVLPGLLRKWSSLQPPEIVALAAGASRVTVRIYDGTRISKDALLVEEATNAELVVVPIKHHELSDGEYAVAMFVENSTRPVSTALLRLRSADTPQFNVDDADIRLVYSPDSAPTWPLSAGAAEWESYVNGGRVVGDASNEPLEFAEIQEYSPRERRQKSEKAHRLSIGTQFADDTCFATGMHRFQLPPVVPGHNPTRTIAGECTTCGLVKRFAGTPWAARKRDTGVSKVAIVTDIPPIAEADGPDFQVAFDSLNHVGHGSGGAFERIAAQVEGSGLFADSFLRRQEVVGNIDVARDEWLRVSEWAVNSATLVPIDVEKWVLVGSRSRRLLDGLESILGKSASIARLEEGELSIVEVSGLAMDLATHEEELAKLGITTLYESPAMAIAERLPRLSTVEKGLTRIAVPKYRSLEWWETKSAAWEPTESIGDVGAYRMKDFRSTYVTRSAADIDSGTVALGNAQLVKHIANMWARDPLVGYHAKSESVIAPLGADLPGMYGRALSICSGRAPREIVESRMIQYRTVPRDVANSVFARLSD